MLYTFMSNTTLTKTVSVMQAIVTILSLFLEGLEVYHWYLC